MEGEGRSTHHSSVFESVPRSPRARIRGAGCRAATHLHQSPVGDSGDASATPRAPASYNSDIRPTSTVVTGVTTTTTGATHSPKQRPVAGPRGRGAETNPPPARLPSGRPGPGGARRSPPASGREGVGQPATASPQQPHQPPTRNGGHRASLALTYSSPELGPSAAAAPSSHDPSASSSPSRANPTPSLARLLPPPPAV